MDRKTSGVSHRNGSPHGGDGQGQTEMGNDAGTFGGGVGDGVIVVEVPGESEGVVKGSLE